MPSILDRLRATVARFFTWSSSLLSDDSTVVIVTGSSYSVTGTKLGKRVFHTKRDCADLRLKDENLGEEDVATILNSHPNCGGVRAVIITDIVSLTQVPASIGKFSNVTSLDLSSNGLTDLPWTIVYLRNLRSLNLYNNHFDFLPPIIGHLAVLTDLNVAHNLLHSLPTSLIHLKKLNVLNVDGNGSMMSPPLSVCQKGRDAIIAHLRVRHGRKNLWQNCTAKYMTMTSESDTDTEMKSLLELCVATVLNFKINYFAMTNVPPALKRHLYKKCQEKMTGSGIKLSKCSRCGKFFSTEQHFDNHTCS